MNTLPVAFEDVHTFIGPYHVLQGVSLTVATGRTTVLLGRNGAGKTTTLRTLMGLWRAARGRIRAGGEDITAWATPRIARLGFAYVPENMGIFADLTVAENLLLAARGARRPGDIDPQRLARILAAFPAIETFWHRPAGKLSGGQKQMVAVARAMVEPRCLLIVDEPSKGLAPAIVHNMQAAFSSLKAEGMSILLVEQNLAFARALGDDVAVMDNGRIVHAGSMAAFAADGALQQRHLGLAL